MSEPTHGYETYIKTTPERLWQALTEPDQTQRYFFGTRLEADWRKGGRLAYRNPDGSAAVEGEVLEVDPPRRLSYTWRTLYDDDCSRERPSRVTWEIEALGSLCKLSLLHDEFETGSKTYTSVSSGWNGLVCSLKTLLETGEPLPYPPA